MSEAQIVIHGAHSMIRGEYCMPTMREATSYPVQGAQFSKAYRKGLWDGRKHLMNKRTGAFPTGLVPGVRRALEARGCTTTVEDKRHASDPIGNSFDLEGVKFEYPYDYQLEICKAAVAAKQGIIKAATGAGKSELSCAIMKYIGRPALFIVPTQELMYQSQQRFMTRLNMSEDEIGLIGDGKWKPGTLITVGMLPTLEARLNQPTCQEFLKDIEVLFFDEAHRCGSETWYTLATMCPAYWRFGLSGTPLDRTDGANLRLIAATGEQICDISNKFLVDRGITARANIIFDKISTPILPKKIVYATAYKQGVSENPEALLKVVQWTKALRDNGLSVLILCEEIAHGRLIDDALWTHEALEGMFVPHQFVYGDESSETRRTALEQFSKRELPVLIGSTIFDEGIDCYSIDAMILAGSRKSRIRTLQRLGRGLRGDKLIVVEFANFCHKYLLEHSHQRLMDYKDEECFPVYYSDPDAALIAELWAKERDDK